MPFGFRKKGEEEKQRIITNITDKEDLDEIKKIAEMLNPNEEVFVVARQSRLKPGGSHFTPNIVFATDRRIIIKDPSMLGLHEEVVDIPYDMITSVRLDKGVFSSNVIFRAPGLRITGRLGMIEKLTGSEYGGGNSGTGEDTVITAIPKDKAQELVEVIRNGVDRQREVYQQPQPQQQFQQPTTTPQGTHIDTTSDNNNNSTISIADELAKLANLKKQGVITESEFLQMKQDLIRRK
jgi:Bacterial PH domain/Short C-terminal domain